MQFIYIKINTFVHGLDTPGDDYLPLELPRLVLADHSLQLPDQRIGFLVRNELGRLHGIHQQFEFRQFKVTVSDVVIVATLHLYADDIHPEITQQFKVLVQRLPLRVHTVGVQLVHDLRQRKRMLVIRILGKNLDEIQQLQLLVIDCHPKSPPYDRSTEISL